MKTAIIFLNLFVSFVRRFKIYFVLSIAVTIVGTISLLFLYSSSVDTMLKYQENSKLRSIVIELAEMEDINDSDWSYLENNKHFDNIHLEMWANKKELNLNTEYVLIESFKNDIENNGTSFKLQSDKELILSHDIYDFLFDKNRIDDFLPLSNENYRIIGYKWGNSLLEIPYHNFKSQFKPSRITLYLKFDSILWVDEILKELNLRFLGNIRYNLDEQNLQLLKTTTILIILASALIFLNYIFFYSFLFLKRKKEFIIYRLYGLNRTKILLYLLFESTIIYVISLMIGIICFTPFIFNKQDLFYRYLTLIMWLPLVIKCILIIFMHVWSTFKREG